MSSSNINDILISTGITSAVYIIYKIIQRLYQRYYLSSECHYETHSLEIMVVDREEKKEEKEKEETKK